MNTGGWSWLAWWLAPLLGRYLRWCRQTSTLELSREAEAFFADAPPSPSVLLFWQDEVWMLALLSADAGVELPTLALAESWGARIVGRIWSGLGGALAWLPGNASRESALCRMEAALRETSRLALAADQGTPRYSVRTTPWQLSQRVSGTRLVAVHVRASRELSVFGLRIPLPYAAYSVAATPALTADSTLADNRAQVKSALQNLRAPRAVTLPALRPAPEPGPVPSVGPACVPDVPRDVPVQVHTGRRRTSRPRHGSALQG